eukprot:3333463-Rhodomonas_salina.4
MLRVAEQEAGESGGHRQGYTHEVGARHAVEAAVGLHVIHEVEETLPNAENTSAMRMQCVNTSKTKPYVLHTS